VYVCVCVCVCVCTRGSCEQRDLYCNRYKFLVCSLLRQARLVCACCCVCLRELSREETLFLYASRDRTIDRHRNTHANSSHELSLSSSMRAEKREETCWSLQLLTKLVPITTRLLQLLTKLVQLPVPGSCRERKLAEVWKCQKRPATVSKETYYSVKRDLLQCQKRPGSCRERKLAEVWKPRVSLSSTDSAADIPWPAAARYALRFRIEGLVWVQFS
jgi:hypothetical protein